MIPTIYYALGFIVYVFFNIVTFKTYSKKEGITKKFVLYMIFLYYSLLAAYVINVVDFGGSNGLEVMLQTLVFVLAGGLFLNFFYIDIIKEKDQEF